MKYALLTLGAICLLLLTQISLTKSEHAECLAWQQQQNDIANWYSTAWQKEQCKQFNITFTK